MKPKILLVKHFDHAIIALLAILLLVAIYAAFVAKEKKVNELADAIEEYDSIISRQMNRKDLPPLDEGKDYLEELVGRLKHLPVLSPYPSVHNPFYPENEMIIDTALVLPVGQSKEYVLPKTRITDVLQTNEEILRIEYEYTETEDWDNRYTKVMVIAENLSDEKDLQEFKILLRDDADRVFSWAGVVQRSKRSAPPNPPIDVAFAVRGPYEVVGQPSKPPRVLITCSDNDPVTVTREVGVTTGINIYRKRLDTPDIDYILLNDRPIVPIASEAQVEALKNSFYNPYELTPASTGASTPALGGSQGAIVPPEATMPGGGGLGRGQETGMSQGGTRFEVGKTYAFMDDTVDGGESYVYKIETLSVAEDAEPVACTDPFVTVRPITVPSLVDFAVEKMTATGAKCIVSRGEPDTGREISWTFDVATGMRVGAAVTIELSEAEIIKNPGVLFKHIDFTTKNVVVDTLRSQPIIVYTVDLDRKTGYFIYKIKLAKDPQLLYLTPRGSLSVKEVLGSAGARGRQGLGVGGPAGGPSRGPAPGGPGFPR